MEEQPSIEEWRELYEAAAVFRDAKAWDAMLDSDVFGIVDPETGEACYCSVTGAAGEHFSLAVYLGEEGLGGLRRMQAEGLEGDPLELMSVQWCLMASFEDRDQLMVDDREVIKELGLRFRGRGAWPLFRSYRPGYYPWLVTAPEARLLAEALRQAADVARRFRWDPGYLQGGVEGPMLFRVRDEGGEWRDETREPPPTAPPEGPSWPTLDGARVQEVLEGAGRTGDEWEVDAFPLPQPVREGKGDRPHLPRVVQWVERGMGLPLHIAFGEGPGVWPDPAEKSLDLMAEMGVPRAILVRHDAVRRTLQPLCEAAGVELETVDRLPASDAVRRLVSRPMR